MLREQKQTRQNRNKTNITKVYQPYHSLYTHKYTVDVSKMVKDH